MKYKDLRKKIKKAVFTSQEMGRLFINEPQRQVNTQLARMAKRGDLVRLKRGVYVMADQELDELVVAEYLYQPSYISLETALNIYGMMPDIPAVVSCITSVTSKRFKNQWGRFSYSKIDKELFFGFEKVMDDNSRLYYSLAKPEKALLDYIYLRQVKSLKASRIEMGQIDLSSLLTWADLFPVWVRKVFR